MHAGHGKGLVGGVRGGRARDHAVIDVLELFEDRDLVGSGVDEHSAVLGAQDVPTTNQWRTCG
jgi:hypothetical protein